MQKHGHTVGPRGGPDPRSPTYNSWRGMIDRCYCPSSGAYAKYGARGIAICDRWRKFAAFLADMGERPPGLTIERIDNDGNYEPSNCRWASVKSQARNRRSTRLVTAGGKTGSLAEMAELFARDQNKVRHRLNRGWSDERALTTPT